MSTDVTLKDISVPWLVRTAKQTGSPQCDASKAELVRRKLNSQGEPISPAPITKGDQAKQGGTSPQDTNAALEFLDDIIGDAPRLLHAIKKPGAPISHMYQAADLDGQRKFIIDHQSAGRDCYFQPNPVKGLLHKKPGKNDMAEARWLWIDLDPRVGEPLEAERKAMLGLLTDKLPAGIPRPNRVIDSGRGYWGFWKLDKAQPVDGWASENVPGPLTAAVESYGIGIERAFGDRFADGCRNIDRIARLPGSVNHKTGQLARVLPEYSHDEPYTIESFTRVIGKPKEKDSKTCDEKDSAKSKGTGDGSVITSLDAAELRGVAPDVMAIILHGKVPDYAPEELNQMKGGHVHFKVVAELIRAGLTDKQILQVYMLGEIADAAAQSGRGLEGYLEKTIAAARAAVTDDVITRMNADHAVLPIGGRVTFGELEEFPGRQTIIMTQTLGDFASLQNKYRHEYVDGNGKPHSVPLGDHWLHSQYRRQYDGGMAFMPRHDEQVVGNRLNLWAGYGVKPIKPNGKSGEAGCDKFLDFMRDVICSGDEEHFDYLEKREAFILQERKRSEIALALHTKEEGAGKGFFEKHIGHLYGNHAMQLSNPKHVIGNFNPHLETLLRVTADEALFVGNHEHRNALFSLITESKLTIEPKNCGVYVADNYLNISITSNSAHFIPVSGTARRFFVPTVSPVHMQDFDYFKAIEDQLLDGGYEALLYHLLNEVDLTGFDVRKVPRTAGLAEQAAYSRDGVDGLVEEVCNTGRVPCPHYKWPGFTITSGYEEGTGFAHFIANHRDKKLVSLRSTTVTKRLAKDWGCTTAERKREAGGKDRTQGFTWPALADLRARFEAQFGKQEWLHPEEMFWP